MSNNVPAPSLSRMGWIYDTYPKFDTLMAWWVSSDKRQSDLMPQGVHNLQWIVSRNLQDMTGASSAIQNSLSMYLKPYFEDVNVTCESSLADPETSDVLYRITLTINFTANGKHVDGSRALLVENGKFLQFVNINNNGDPMNPV